VELFGIFNTVQSWANALNAQTALGLFWVTDNGGPTLTTTNDTLEFGDFNYQGTL
jgi:hypothetical protein